MVKSDKELKRLEELARKSSLGLRVTYALKICGELGYSKTQVASARGVTAQAITGWGDGKISGESLAILSDIAKLDLYWLITGKRKASAQEMDISSKKALELISRAKEANITDQLVRVMEAVVDAHQAQPGPKQ